MKWAALAIPLVVAALPAQAAQTAQPASPLAGLAAQCRGQGGTSHQDALAACTALLKAAETPPQMRATILFTRGRHAYLLEDHGKAIADFDQAIKLQPDLPQPYHYRGLGCLRPSRSIARSFGTRHRQRSQQDRNFGIDYPFGVLFRLADRHDRSASSGGILRGRESEIALA